MMTLGVQSGRGQRMGAPRLVYDRGDPTHASMHRSRNDDTRRTIRAWSEDGCAASCLWQGRPDASQSTPVRSRRDNRARQYDSDMTTEACQYDSDVATEARCTFDSVPLV